MAVLNRIKSASSKFFSLGTWNSTVTALGTNGNISGRVAARAREIGLEVSPPVRGLRGLPLCLSLVAEIMTASCSLPSKCMACIVA